MSWQEIEGHDAILERFRHSLSSGRLGSTFLFVGLEGIGKRTFGLKLAQSLLCHHASEQMLDPCGACAACSQVLAGSHPDLELIAKPADRSFIPIDLLIGDKQHRMREGLCARMAMRPFSGRRKIAIIDDADDLNQEGANCLLKTLEEPPPGSVLMLIATSPQRQLPTIRSRSQIIRFQPLSVEVCARLLRKLAIAEDDQQALRLARLSGGSLTRAIEWNDPQLWDFRIDLLQALAQPKWDSLDLAQQIGTFVDAAGKEAPRRRARLKQVLDIVEQFYRQAMYRLVGAAIQADEGLAQLVEQSSFRQAISAETAADCVDRTQTARIHVAANANQATNIEAWLDDLSQLCHAGTALQPSFDA